MRGSMIFWIEKVSATTRHIFTSYNQIPNFYTLKIKINSKTLFRRMLKGILALL